MSFSIRLSDEERNLVESYSKLHSISIAEAFKQALFEKIYDELDAATAESAYAEYLSGGRESRPASEFWRELQL